MFVIWATIFIFEFLASATNIPKGIENINVKKGETIEESIERLTEEMMAYARKYEFEKAATIRDFIEELKNMK